MSGSDNTSNAVRQARMCKTTNNVYHNNRIEFPQILTVLSHVDI